MQIQCFQTENIFDLETQVNKFLDRVEPYCIKEVEYENVYRYDEGSVEYTAMIIYEGPKVENI